MPLEGHSTLCGPRPPLSPLRVHVRQIEGRHRRATTVLRFGAAAVDSRLPGCGLPCGALHEVAGGGNGAIDGAAAALFAAGIAARTHGKVLWCVTRPDLFAPSLSQAGLKSDRVIYLEGGGEKTVLTCFEEGLRTRRRGGGSRPAEHDCFAAPFSSPPKGRGQSASRCAAGVGRPRRRISASRPPPRPVGASRRCLRRRFPSLASVARAGWSS